MTVACQARPRTFEGSSLDNHYNIQSFIVFASNRNNCYKTARASDPDRYFFRFWQLRSRPARGGAFDDGRQLFCDSPLREIPGQK